MNIVKKDLDQNNAVVTVHVEKADYAEKVNKYLRDYRKKASIPGFRPGMVPLGLLTKMYGKAVMTEEINKLVVDELYKFIGDNQLNVLGEPLPNETEQPEIDFNTQDEFDFVFDLGIAPAIDTELSKKDKITFYNLSVSDEMIDNQIKSYTTRFGKYEQEEVVEESDMLKGDLLEMKDGKVNEAGINVQDAVLTPSYMKDEIQKNTFLGAKKDDVIVFNPSTAFENETEISSLLKISKEAAKEIDAEFQFSIKNITRFHEGEINQELFDKVFGDGNVKSEEEFRTKIKENIAESLTTDSDYKFGLDTRNMLLEKYTDLSFPDAFLKRWVLHNNKDMSEETIEKDYPKMLESLKWMLLKDDLMKKFEIKVELPDVLQHAKNVAKAQFAQYGMVGLEDQVYENYAQDMLKKEETMKEMTERVSEEKVFAKIKELVTLQPKDISIEDFNKFFAAN